MNYVMAVSRDVITLLSSNQVLIMVCSAVAGLVAMMTAGRRS